MATTQKINPVITARNNDSHDMAVAANPYSTMLQRYDDVITQLAATLAERRDAKHNIPLDDLVEISEQEFSRFTLDVELEAAEDLKSLDAMRRLVNHTLSAFTDADTALADLQTLFPFAEHLFDASAKLQSDDAANAQSLRILLGESGTQELRQFISLMNATKTAVALLQEMHSRVEAARNDAISSMATLRDSFSKLINTS